MENVPILDQGDMGICYAYAASEAVDAWRFSGYPEQGTGFHTSPHAAAIGSKSSQSRYDRASSIFNFTVNPHASVLDAAFTENAVRALKKDGICSYDAFGANFQNSMYQRDPQTFWLQFQDLYDFFHKQYLSALMKRDQGAQDRILRAAGSRLTSLACSGNFGPGQRDFEDLNEAVQIIAADTVLEAFKRLSARICAGHTQALPADFPSRPVAFSIDQITHPVEARAIQTRGMIYSKVINAMFDFKKRQPLMITFCAEVLTDPGHTGLSDKDGSIGKCGSHATLIIGRGTMTDGRCGFLIRNSWGKDWDDDPTTNANGDIWVAEDDLYRNLMGVSVIPPRGENYKPPSDTYAGVAEALAAAEAGRKAHHPRNQEKDDTP